MRVHRGCPLTIAAIIWLGLTSAGRSYELASKWTQTTLGAPVELSFSYSNLLDGGMLGLSTDELRAATIEGLQLWSAVAPLQLIEAEDSGPPPTSTNYAASTHPNIRIGHAAISQGNVLARSYYPSLTGLAGDVHLNERFTWSLNTGQVGPNYTFDLIEVATHELGHALGLEHVTGVPAIMDPGHQNLFNGLTTGYLLADDIAGMQANYGAGLGYVLDRSGRLYLSGTEDANAVGLRLNGGQLTGTSEGFGSFSRGYAGVTAVEINARGGADQIELNDLTEQVSDVRLLYGTANVNSGTVTHGGSASDVDGYRWSNSQVRLNAGSLLVRGDESGATSPGAATFIQSGGVHSVGGTLRVGDGAGEATYLMQDGTLELGMNATAPEALVVGQSATGVFTQTGGIVNVRGGTLRLGVDASGSGVYNLEGGVLDLMNHEIARGAGAGMFNLNGGALKNVARLDGDLNQQAGTLSAGASPGVMTITGDYTLGSGGTVEVELSGPGGVAGIDHDLYEVLGEVALDGALEIVLLGNYQPQMGDAFDILDWGGVSGSFSALSLPALDESLKWDTSELYVSGSLLVSAAEQVGDLDDDGQLGAGDIDALWRVVRGVDADDPGGDDEEDLNGDGTIDGHDVDYLLASAGRLYGDADLDNAVGGLDYDAWKLRAGRGWAHGDFDGDGGVGGLDYTLWRTRPTAMPWEIGDHSADGSAMPVPEPSSWILAAACGLAALVRVRRQKNT